MGRSEVWRWSRITWSCPGGMEDKKVTAVIAADGDQREFDLKTRVTANGDNKTPRCFTVMH